MYQKEKVCHSHAVEIIPNFWIGSYAQQLEMLHCDVLVPLDSLSPDIWDFGFRGQIIYCPILDYGTLPDDVLDDLVEQIIDLLDQGKSVGMFCLGGHGRTGYVASVVLGKKGIKNPIKYIRKNYCRLAIESPLQVKHIAKVLNSPELKNSSIPI